MRKLKIIKHISLDGVIQHSADGNNFRYSDWTAPDRTPAGRDAVLAAYGESFDLLLAACQTLVGRSANPPMRSIFPPILAP